MLPDGSDRTQGLTGMRRLFCTVTAGSARSGGAVLLPYVPYIPCVGVAVALQGDAGVGVEAARGGR